MKYSSPSALLNRYFKKSKKFKYIFGEADEYENESFLLTWIAGEKFSLGYLEKDFDTGYIGFDDIFCGELTECVEKMRRYYKTGEI